MQRSYYPEGASVLVEKWLGESPVRVRYVKPRRTKTGDFRPARDGSPPMITLNHNLHPVEMLITFCHELAHYRVYRKYRIRRSPHGKEWKSIYRQLLAELLEAEVLEKEVNQAIYHCFFKREKIGSGLCEKLYDVLYPLGIGDSEGYSEGDSKGKEEGKRVRRVRDLEEGEPFKLRGGKVFIKGPKNRTRYRCKELKSGKMFTVHGMAEVVDESE